MLNKPHQKANLTGTVLKRVWPQNFEYICSDVAVSNIRATLLEENEARAKVVVYIHAFEYIHMRVRTYACMRARVYVRMRVYKFLMLPLLLKHGEMLLHTSSSQTSAQAQCC